MFVNEQVHSVYFYILFSPQVLRLPLSGSDHMPLQAVEAEDSDREDLLEESKCRTCSFLSYSLHILVGKLVGVVDK